MFRHLHSQNVTQIIKDLLSEEGTPKRSLDDHSMEKHLFLPKVELGLLHIFFPDGT